MTSLPVGLTTRMVGSLPRSRELIEGDWLLIYMEANEVAKALGDFAVSKDPFELLARNNMKGFTGVDFAVPAQGPPPAQLFAYGY
jgi:hypothetical protein